MATVIIGVGLSIVAGYLLRKKPPKPELDTSSPTLSERGSFAPLVLGTRRIGPVIGAVWGRESQRRSSGGGKGGGGSSQKYYVYSEKAWHILCVGPINRLDGIYMSGAPLAMPFIPEYPTYEESTIFDVPARELSHCGLYFGTEDGPVNTELAAHTGVYSSWPNIAYVYWDQFFLGQSPIWPQLEYVVTSKINNPVLVDSAAWLDDGSTTGVNPAHALYQILTAPYPWGCNIPAEYIDLGYFEELGASCEAEHIPANILASDGPEAASFIADLLNDQGIVIPQISDVLSPLLMREVTGTVVAIPSDLVSSKPTEIDIANEANQINRMVYQFSNAANQYATQDIVVEDDSIFDTRLVKKEQVSQLKTVTHYADAAKIVNRKEQEGLVGDQTIKFTGSRRVINLSCGRVFLHPDGNQYRCVSVELNPDDETVTVEAVPDIYFQLGDSVSGIDPNYPDGPESGLPNPDSFDLISVTRALSSNLGMFFVRGRDNSFVIGSTGYASLDNASFTQFGEASDYALAVGTVRAITYDGVPVITIDRGSAGDVNDNSVQVPDIRYLSQSIAFGGDLISEVGAYDTWTVDVPDITTAAGRPDGTFSVRSLTKLTPYTQTVNGETVLVTYNGQQAYLPTMTLADDEFQTKRNDPKLGERCFIFLRDLSVVHEFDSFYARVDAGAPDFTYGKTQPYTAAGAADLSGITSEERWLSGAALAPLPPQNFATDLTGNQHNGTTVTFEWDAVSSDDYSTGVAVGDFIIEIRNLAGDLVGATHETSGTAGAKSHTVNVADIVPVAADREAFYADIFACDDADNPLYRSFISRILVTQTGTRPIVAGLNTLVVLLDDTN